ncbi:MAG: glycine cleavage system aminomethyltransferase GcvT [Candidatus Palauibacterales bacterium]|nr:glycine cleavage system aminomethyltransferase GcvT [Candidatus Palauibacterales bacterium]MDP2483354.1 glycine cleavage system aminomethyltransferase GcvT [Candidatus Palauibacterales bacterium]
MSELKRTPLYEAHVALGAKIVPFAGFEMPVQYPTGITREHTAVRTSAGMFDVSHMGEFLVEGPGALAFVSYVTTNDPALLSLGQVQYSVFCLQDGGIVDDLLVYRMGEQRFRLVVNGANIDKDWAHVAGLAGDFDVELSNESDDIGLIALQGPSAEAILQPLVDVELAPIGFYWFAEGHVDGVPGIISRTGYTGEAGFELYLPPEATRAVWDRLLEVGGERGLIPAGLGSRDSLRLEMGYALYGNDIDEHTTPLEAGLSWLVKLGKDSFVGQDALRAQKEEGLSRRLRGFRLAERGFPRPGYDVIFRGAAVGPVRSGTLSPSLGAGIGTVYLPAEAKAGDPVSVRIRDRDIPGEVVPMPFYDGGSLRR